MYATFQDIIDRYGATAESLAGLDTEGNADTARMDRALLEATSEIDATLAGRYQLPLATVPPVLRRMAVDLAVAALPQNGGDEASLFERRGKEARTLLAAIGKGDITLGLPQASGGGSAGGGGVAFDAPSSDFRTTIETM